MGNSAQALTHYQAALQIRQSLAERLNSDVDLSKLPPANQREIQQSVATSELAVGEALSRFRSHAEAAPCFESAVQSLRTDFDSNPDEITTKRLLGNAAGMCADLHVRCGDLEIATQDIALSYQLLQEVVAADPDISRYQRELGVACLRRGVVLQVAEAPSAADWFKQCCEIRHRLAEVSKNNEKLQRELMVAMAHTDESEKAAAMARNFANAEDADNEVLMDVARSLAQCALRADSAQEAKQLCNDAVLALQRAVHHGFRDLLLLQYDPELKPLHAADSFQQLLAEMPAASEQAMVE
jgi:tetratricopeptide (TPR) repeat protein